MKGSTNASARPNIRIQDASAEFVANTDTDTNADFPYRASVSITGVTHYMSATVIYSQAQCISGAYSTYCQTYDGGVYLYAKTNVGTQTIPAISCDISVNYINVDNVPTEDSQAVITSGGVYANCVRTSGDQDIAGGKIFSVMPVTRNSGSPSYGLKNTVLSIGVAPSSWTSTGAIRFYDKNDVHFGVVESTSDNGTRGVFLRVNTRKTSNSDNWAKEFGTFTDAEGSAWAISPYRTTGLTKYDVLTAGNGVVCPNNANYKWILKTGWASLRFQSNVQHSVTINLGVTVVDPNWLFPMVSLGYDGSSWGDVTFNVANRTSTGFDIHSWVPMTVSSSVDFTGTVYWMALVPIA